MDALVAILLSIIPGALYAFIIWITVPYKSFSLRQAYSHILLGMLSITFVNLAHSFFAPLYDESITIAMKSKLGDVLFLHRLSFFQVGITEEVSKWLAFIFICSIRNVSDDGVEKDSPMATMIYCAMVSLGFAILENVHYGATYGSGVLFSRLFSAVLLHIEVGLMMGYWIALSRINISYTKSIIGVIFNKNKRLKKIILTFIGISTAVFVHGLYDFNLFVTGQDGLPLMYTILGLGAFISYIGANHLIALTKK